MPAVGYLDRARGTSGGAVDRGGHTVASGDRAAMLTGAVAAALACAVALRGVARTSPRPRHG